MDAITDAYDEDVRMIDGTSVRVHHSAATLKKPLRSRYRTKPGRSYFENSCSDRWSWFADQIDTHAGPDP